MKQNPIRLLARALGLWLRGRVRMADAAGSELLEVGDEKFVPFRKVVVVPGGNRVGRSGAIFQVRFSFRNLSAAANRGLSLIPIPLIVAQPGFRSKTWLLGRLSGDFIGRYEFETVAEAEAYWNSLPLRMMRKRAAPGSLTKNVIPFANKTVASEKGEP